MLRLVTYNLWDGGEGGGGRRLDLLASVVRGLRPDVAVLCEANGWAEDARAFADFCAAVSMRGHVAPSPSGAHLAVLVRPPVTVTAFSAEPMGGLNPAAFARLTVPRLPAGEAQLVGIHLDYRDARTRLAEVSGILDALDPSLPLALMGDVNGFSSLDLDPAGPAQLLALPLHHVPRHVDEDGELDVRALALPLERGLVDSYRALHPNAAFAQSLTVPTGVPMPPNFGPMRLDQILLSPDLAAGLVECRIVRDAPAPTASDHFPVLAVVDESRVPRLLG